LFFGIIPSFYKIDSSENITIPGSNGNICTYNKNSKTWTIHD